MAKSVRIPARAVPEERMWAEKRTRQRRDRAAIARGEVTSESMHLIPHKIARKAKVTFKNVTFDDDLRVPKNPAGPHDRRKTKR